MSIRWTEPETIRDVKRLIVRYRRRFVLVCLAVASLTLIACLALPRKYQAQASFERRNDLVMMEMAGRGAPHSFEMMQRSLTEQLRGMPAIQKAIDDLELLPDPAEVPDPDRRLKVIAARQRLAAQVHQNTTVKFDVSTNEMDRVRLTYVGTDPQRARSIINRLVENYIEQARGQIDQMLTRAAGFFEEQSNQCRDQINKAEQQLLQFEVEHTALLPENRDGIQSKIATAEEQLITLEQRQRSNEAELAMLQSQLDDLGTDTPATVVEARNPEYIRVSQRLEEHRDQLEHAMLIEKMTANHPQVIALKQKIASIETELSTILEQIVTQKVYGESTKRTNLELQLMEASNTKQTLVQQIALATQRLTRMRSKLTDILPARTEYRKLEREIANLQQQLSFWEENRRKTTMSLTAELGQRGITLDFVGPCQPIGLPSTPMLSQILFATLLISLLSGVAAVLLTDRADQSLRSHEHAEAILELPVIGAVAEIFTARQLALMQLRDRVLVPACMALMLGIVAIVSYLNYDSLHNPILRQQTNDPVQMLSDTPTDPPLTQAVATVPGSDQCISSITD